MQENIATRVVDAFGGLTKASRATGIPISTIDSWRDSGKIPSWRRPALIAAAEREGLDLPNEFLNSEAA